MTYCHEAVPYFEKRSIGNRNIGTVHRLSLTMLSSLTASLPYIRLYSLTIPNDKPKSCMDRILDFTLVWQRVWKNGTSSLKAVTSRAKRLTSPISSISQMRLLHAVHGHTPSANNDFPTFIRNLLFVLTALSWSQSYRNTKATRQNFDDNHKAILIKHRALCEYQVTFNTQETPSRIYNCTKLRTVRCTSHAIHGSILV